ncbi:MAG: single-stranded DNA-binding protein [Clostridiales bacterium]|nr:single-stranded DNA-binding protein [Clostridiales bacterium]MCF8022491.1 single-stranded DNA-binding protein [Clostridiales bacterium]
MLNRIILIGRLTRDPELRHTTNGTPVANFTLAVNRDFNNRQGEKDADFINIVVWRKQAENVANYMSKGKLVAVEGRLQIRSYDDSQGIRRKAAEVIANNVKFLDKMSGGEKTENPFDSGSSESTSNDFDNFGSEISFNEDDVPF